MTSSLEQNGSELAKGVVAESQRLVLAAALGNPDGAGARGLLSLPEVRAFARSEAVLSLVTPHLGPDAQPVRALFFDKTPASNWLVPWNQDVTVKHGIPHVQPPEALLAQMIAVRVHLDGCDASNGALRVMPGSHRRGRLEPDQILAAKAACAEVVCEAAAGDALLMRPLLLHASSKSVTDRRRRILHIEYCAGRLPAGMTWHDAA